MSAPLGKAVLLVTMPWRIADCPNLALGVLKPILVQQGFTCDVLEAGLIASAMMPPVLYQALGRDTVGEVAFAPYAYDGYDPAHAQRCLRQRFPHLPHGDGEIDAGRGVELAGELLDRLLATMDFGVYDAIGFTLTFQQTLASVALARRIKSLQPHLRIVVGGACCDGPMGEALLQEFPVFDYAVCGRAETSVARVFEVACGRGAPTDIPGLYHRDADGGVRGTPLQEAVTSLDALPLPDFSDYFALRQQLGLSRRDVRILLETSNGCWWGEKHLCTFCGLNATQLAYRQKSGARVLHEIEELSRRYEVDTFELVDNIVPMSALDDVMPQLAALNKTYTAFAEVKTNLRKEQLALLARAGFRFLQPGIESFDDHILELMDKGATGITQVQFVKWCTELRINVGYGLLVSNPGERAEDYERMTDWIPSIMHLAPPYSSPHQIVLARFSPYFEQREKWNIRDVEPVPIFRDVFPHAPDERLARLVYMFVFRNDELREPALVAARQRFTRAVERWRAVHTPLALTHRTGADWVRISDGRASLWSGAAPHVERILLRGLHAQIYRACDRARTRAHLAAEFKQVSSADLDRYLDEMVRRRLLIDDGNKVLALSIALTGELARDLTPPPQRTPDEPNELLAAARALGFATQMRARVTDPRARRRLALVGQNNRAGQ